MGILSAIKTFFGAIGALFGWLDRRQLIEAGKAEANNDANLQARKRVSNALDNPVSDELRAKRFRD